MSTEQLRNFVGGDWIQPLATESLPVMNPATGEAMAHAPLSSASDVDRAVQAAKNAFPAWREIPPGDRIQCLFKLKNLLEEHLDDLAKTITNECGKTYEEAAGEMRRGIENVEVACGIPMMMQGYNSE